MKKSFTITFARTAGERRIPCQYIGQDLEKIINNSYRRINHTITAGQAVPSRQYMH
jgi:hypothetical protein